MLPVSRSGASIGKSPVPGLVPAEGRGCVLCSPSSPSPADAREHTSSISCSAAMLSIAIAGTSRMAGIRRCSAGRSTTLRSATRRQFVGWQNARRESSAACGKLVYVETSHAFLKSWSDLAAEMFPQLKLVHLVRDPLKVAKSEANRHAWLDWFHFPLRNYRGGDGRHYPRWALTTLEPIYQPLAEQPLTLFQRYVVQWIEIENRAMRFLEKFDKYTDCITLQSPHDLNDRRARKRDVRILRRETSPADNRPRRSAEPQSQADCDLRSGTRGICGSGCRAAGELLGDLSPRAVFEDALP